MSTGRNLRDNERDLIAAMLKGKPHAELMNRLSACSVVDMQDGGMGSIRFTDESGAHRSLAEAIAEADYIEDDGILVSIVLNTDTAGQLYEVGLWKVDFSPLGDSMGGFIVTALLGAHPERLRSAIVGGAGWIGSPLDNFRGMIDRRADALEQGKGLGPLVTMLAPQGETAGGAQTANRKLMERQSSASCFPISLPKPGCAQTACLPLPWSAKATSCAPGPRRSPAPRRTSIW